jgi:DNA helicase HerA-like ATPase
LVIASQRPSDVSPTVLSQCANFLVHRIQNPDDIDYFKKILPTGSREILEQLPILAPGDGILVGSALNVPTRVRIPLPNPKPDSDTPRPWVAWSAGAPQFDFAGSSESWLDDTPDAAINVDSPVGEDDANTAVPSAT